MEPITPVTEHNHETGSFSEYKKQLSNKMRAKTAYASAISQNVFASFDKIESAVIKNLPAAL